VQFLEDRAGRGGADFEMEIGREIALRKHARNEDGCESRTDPHHHRFHLDAAEPAGNVAEIHEVGDDALRFIEEHAAVLGRLHTAAGAPEELEPDACLQKLHLLGDGGLGHIKPRARAGETALLGHSQGVSDLSKFHPLLHHAWPDASAWKMRISGPVIMWTHFGIGMPDSSIAKCCWTLRRGPSTLQAVRHA